MNSTKILISPKILANATNSGFKYLEQNNYPKAEEFLEYVNENSPVPDQYVLYGLGIAYYNQRKLKDLKRIFTDLEKFPGVNEQIRNTIVQMNAELDQKRKNEIQEVQETVDHLLEILGKSKEELREIYKKTQNSVYKSLSKHLVPEYGYRDLNRKLKFYYTSCESFYELSSQYFEPQKKLDSFKLHMIYSEAAKNRAHDIFMILALENGLFRELLTDPKIGFRFKNEILADIKLYSKKGYIRQDEIEYTDDNEHVNTHVFASLPTVPSQMELVFKEIKDSPLSRMPKLARYILNLFNKYLKIHYLEIGLIDSNVLYKRICNYIVNTKTVNSKKINDYLQIVIADFEFQTEDPLIEELILIYEKISPKRK